MSEPLDCRDFVELVTEYLEGTLDADTRARFDEHLCECPYCETYLDQIRATMVTLGHVALDVLSPESRAELFTAFRTWSSGRGSDPSS